MTKYFSSIALAVWLAMAFAVDAQTIDINLGFQPNQIIEQTSLQKNTQLMTFSGSKELLRQLAQSGMENPKLTETEVNSRAKIETGELDEEGEFPVTMEYLERSDSATTDGLLIGTKFHGSCYEDDLPEFDSISGGDLEGEMEEMVLGVINKMMEQTNIPLETLTLGKPEKVKSTMSIPLAGMNIEMDMVVHYTLTKVDGSLAYIDLRTDMKMELDGLPMEIEGDGKGNGKMVYSTTNQLVESMEQTIEMELGFDQDIQGEKLKIHMDQTTFVQVTSTLLN